MKINKYIYAGLVAGALCLTTSCSESELADINTNPSVVTTPDIRYLFTQGLQNFKPSEYWSWYYDFSAMCRYGQVTGGDNTNRLNMPDLSSGGGNVKHPLLTLLEIENQMKQKDAETAATFTNIHAMMQALVVYMGIQDTDFYGSMPYSEAYRARYGGTLTPKYDTQEELFNQFYAELKKATDDLTNDVVVNGKTVSQVSLGNQDFVYKGDAAKWAKFANSLKLKLAVRLLKANPELAKTIAQDAVSHKAGLMTSVDDDFIYNQGSEWYHNQENVTPGVGNYNLIKFLVDNRDPRVRFFFEKNDFNSEVVQAYFDAGKELPSYIAENVEYTEVTARRLSRLGRALANLGYATSVCRFSCIQAPTLSGKSTTTHRASTSSLLSMVRRRLIALLAVCSSSSSTVHWTTHIRQSLTAPLFRIRKTVRSTLCTCLLVRLTSISQSLHSLA